ncbi:MAG: DUF2339 domain-containing protein [Gemmatimonadaceae bacterium]|nr:DUF2339 domain-containing protein [Gemmatimonadaceae bacterium]
MSDTSRLDALELAVARLARELVALRSEVRAARPVPDPQSAPRGVAPHDVAPRPVETTVHEHASGAPRHAPYVSDELRRMASAPSSSAQQAPPAPLPPVPPRSPRAGSAPSAAAWSPSFRYLERENLESLIGRYGTLALAAFTILMGVGAFVGWAVRNGLIGPEVRVALGSVAAIGVAMVGLRLRRGDSPRFGSVLLALALAIMHVVCWGAGPLLQVVPGAVALVVAAASSAALSTLAIREEDQSLFNIGFGGALLAPFVTSTRTGDPVLLLLYGGFVLAAGMRAMRDRAWARTPFVLGLGVAAYTAAASGQLADEETMVRAVAPALFAVAVAWLSILLVQGRARERVAVTALLAALGAIANMHPLPAWQAIRPPLAALVTISGFLVLTAQGATRWMGVLVGLVIPAGSWLVAISPLQGVDARPDGITSLLWAVGCAVAAWYDRDGARRWTAFTATAIGGMALVILLEGNDQATAIALAGYAAAVSLVLRQVPLGGIAFAAGGWLSVATALAFHLLDRRDDWLPRPFLTSASGVAAVVCAAWFVFAWNWARMGMAAGSAAFDLRRNLARILGAVVTFAWVHVELQHTVSLDVSTFLLVAYYAVTGVAAIGVGRARAIPPLRHVGLALAVLAAIKAMLATSSLGIGWRVGGYLLAGAFLLGVAYWYRGRGAGPGEATADVHSGAPHSSPTGDGASRGSANGAADSSAEGVAM